MTFDIAATCECAKHGLPEGYICGKPDCPRTLAANESLAKITEALFGPKEEKDVDVVD